MWWCHMHWIGVFQGFISGQLRVPAALSNLLTFRHSVLQFMCKLGLRKSEGLFALMAWKVGGSVDQSFLFIFILKSGCRRNEVSFMCVYSWACRALEFVWAWCRKGVASIISNWQLTAKGGGRFHGAQHFVFQHLHFNAAISLVIIFAIA